MKTVQIREVIPVEADRAWAFVRDLDNVGAHASIVDDCKVVDGGGSIDRFFRVGDVSFHQHLEARDDAARTMTIRTVETDLPVESLVTTISIEETGPGECEIRWEATLEAPTDEDAVAALVRDLYLTALVRFRDHLMQGNERAGV